MNKKFFITALSISIIVLLLILIFTPRRSPAPSIPQNPDSQPSQLRSELTNLTEEKVVNASKYRELVQDRFPIYVKEFKTSVGITTGINIYFLKDDDPSLMRLEIYGLSYMNRNELDPKVNPNITAFSESYVRALTLIREAGVDPKQLIFSYGDRQDVHSTAALWVDKLGLLR